MQVERARELLRLFERASSEHTAWLMRVHSAILFPKEARMPPCAPDMPIPQVCNAACDTDDQLVTLLRLRGAMHARAQELLGRAARDGQVDSEEYQGFMASVDAYSREARRAEAHYRRLLVETDPLTGVHNRQGMMRDLRREWTRALRTGQPLCLALADLDHFKRVNDTYGHCTGDRVLCAAARFFHRRLRTYDMVYRYGGEEFLFCLPNTDAETAGHVLDRLRSHLARMPVIGEEGVRLAITCSIGVAQMVPGRSVHEAIAAADRAMYQAKENGRNRVELAPLAEPPLPATPPAARVQHLRGVVRH